MKRFKSLSALFLALVLALSLSVPAFAATGNNTITSIKYNAEPFTITPYTYTGDDGDGESFKAYEVYALTWDDVFQSFDLRHAFLLDKLKMDKEAIAAEIAQTAGDEKSKDTADALTALVAN